MNNFIVEHQSEDTEHLQKINLWFDEQLKLGTPYDGLVGQQQVRKEVKESKDIGLKQSGLLPEYFNKFLEPAVNKYFDTYPESAEMGIVYPENNDVSIQQYEPNSHGYNTFHYERNENFSKRVFAFITYLNDVTDGGETCFKYQDYSIKPKLGLTIMFPADFTHTHLGKSSTTQYKRLLTGWLSYE